MKSSYTQIEILTNNCFFNIQFIVKDIKKGVGKEKEKKVFYQKVKALSTRPLIQ